jgi:hypothetical protein
MHGHRVADGRPLWAAAVSVVWRAGLAVGLIGCSLGRRVTAQSDGTSSGTGGAASGGGGPAVSPGVIADAMVDALTEFLRALVSPITSLIESHGGALVRLLVQTPHPTRAFGTPVATPWQALHSYYWETLVPLALMLFGLAVGVVILLESTSHLFSGYHQARLKRRALVGLLGILSWWWLNAFALQFVDALTGALVPSLAEISLFQTLSFGAIGVLGTVLSLGADLIVFLLLGVLYYGRQVVLFLYTLLMPVLLVLWIPALGPFGVLAQFARRLASFYVPFLFMPLPVAVLFRLGDLLGTSADLSMGGIGAWLAAIVIPIAALVAPLVLVWQTGRLALVVDQAARRLSVRQARSRAGRTRAGATTAAHRGRNLVRGVRGQPAQRSNGQTVFGSGSSRGHAAGQRVRRALTRVRRGGTNGRAGSGRQGGRGTDSSADDRYEPREFSDDRSARSGGERE